MSGKDKTMSQPNPNILRGGRSGYSMVELLVAITITLIIMGGVYGVMIHNQLIYETETNVADMQQNARIAFDLMSREIRMAGADPAGRAFSGADEPVELGLANEVHIKMDRPRDFWNAAKTPNTPDGALNVVDGYNCASVAVCACSTVGTDAKTDGDNENEFGDGCLNDPGEDVTYRLEGTTLYRILFLGLGPTKETKQPLAENIKALTFTYFEYVQGTGMVPITLEGTPPSVPDPSVIKKINLRILTETEKLVRSRPVPEKREFTAETDILLRNRDTS